MTDINFCRGRKIRPFVGIGLGLTGAKAVNLMTPETASRLTGDDSYVNDPDYADSDLLTFGEYRDYSVALVPRAGVEFINRIRLTAEYRVMKREYSFFGLNLGVVFGGGYLKRK